MAVKVISVSTPCGSAILASHTGARKNMNMESVIVRDLEVMHGEPVFRGTRVLVQTLFEYLESGETLETFLEGFPTVSRENAIAALEEARKLLVSAA